jgi:hypothetical protein
MNIMRWIALPIFVLGCGSETNPGQIGFAPLPDTTIITTSDMGQQDLSIADATQDLIVMPDAEMIPDMSVDVDSADARSDAEMTPDMAETCWGERVGLPTGIACGATPTSGPCNLVTQTGCNVEKFCTFVFNGAGLVPACTAVEPLCAFLAFDEPCAQRVGQTTTQLGTCEPGGFCPAIAAAQNEAVCSRYCELSSGLGCEPAEVCVQIVSGASAQSLAGFGVCSATDVCSL